MSRHDAVLARAAVSTNPLLIQELAEALREEIGAHHKTRIERDRNIRRCVALERTIRGLDAKLYRLDAEVQEARRAASAAHEYANGYAAGLETAKAAIKELFETMKGP